MSVRVTSMEAYREIKRTGKKRTQEQLVMDQIVVGYLRRRDYTLQELEKKLGIGINAVSGRVNGLKKQGLVIERPRRRCSVTQRKVTPVTWYRAQNGSSTWL